MFSPFCHNRAWGNGLLILSAMALILATLFSRKQDNSYSQPMVFSADRPLPTQSCATCHEKETIAFESSPHNRTLRTPRTLDGLERLNVSSVKIGNHESSWIVDQTNRTLLVQSDGWPQRLQVDWLFGSGSHAITPVSLLSDVEGRTELLEHHASWYPNIGIAATLGISNANPTGSGIRAIGQLLNHEKALECFGCHSTHLSVIDGQLDDAGVVPGVQCARCHTQTHEHVWAMENGQSTTFVDDWKKQTPLQSINRCGECHRRADQMTDDELTPANRLLVRFAPVGMSQSACFQRQEDVAEFATGKMQFNCTTCHDPHLSALRDAGSYVKQCLRCHGPDPGMALECKSQPITSQCLSCHMPPVKVQDHLSFTNHWIGVHDTTDD